jgi:hypothetical protein
MVGILALSLSLSLLGGGGLFEKAEQAGPHEKLDFFGILNGKNKQNQHLTFPIYIPLPTNKN